MQFIPAKTILQKVKFNGNLWFGIDYNINLYKGCNQGCIYCDSRSVRYYRAPLKTQIYHFWLNLPISSLLLRTLQQ